MKSNTFTLLSLLSFVLYLPLLFHGVFGSAFEFIKPLQGLKNGDRAKDIQQLKKYLQHFGYLNPKHSNDNDNNNNNDLFDGEMEAAIKTYQINYNLKPTGFLDPETVSLMSKPRCGFPDIIHGKTRMNSARFHSHYSFPNDTKFKWPVKLGGTPLALGYGFKEGFNFDFVKRIWEFGFKQWQFVFPQIYYTFSPSYRRASLKISFERRDHGHGNPFDGPGGVLAHADLPTGSFCHFDVEDKFAVGEVNGTFDIGTVALHEIGHLIGLLHSSDENAVMWPYMPEGKEKRLNDDDIQGIKALYSTA